MRRALRIALVVVAVIGVAALVAQRAITRSLEVRLRSAIADNPDIDGGLARVSTCLACLSYTIHDLRLDTLDDSGHTPLLRADEVEVGYIPFRLLDGAPVGDITLRNARLRLDLGREQQGRTTAFRIAWRGVGERLLPAPIERVRAEGGVITLRHDGFEKPVEWRFEVQEARADRLSPQAPGTPRLKMLGRTPGEGRFALRIHVRDDGDRPSELRAELHGVPLLELRDVIEQRAGVDVEGGVLSADVRLRGERGAWRGHADCAVRDLDVFDVDDIVERGLLQAARDGAAELLSSLRRSDGGDLELRVGINQDYDEPGTDPWAAAGLVLRDILLAPFSVPLQGKFGT